MVQTDDEANRISARGALLDFYGNRAVSFASLSVASVFGLVAIVAVIQGIGADGLKSVFLSGKWWVNLVAVIVSALLYVVLTYVGYYAFSKLRTYSYIADKIIEGELERYGDDTWDSKVKFEVDLDEKDKKALEKRLELLRTKKITTSIQIGKGKRQMLNLSAYIYYLQERHKFSLIAFVKDHNTLLRFLFALGALGLGFLAYYPVVTAFV